MEPALARVGPGMLLAAQNPMEPVSDLLTYAWEWHNRRPWGDGSSWVCMHGEKGGQVVLMFVIGIGGWKLMWTEDSDQVVGTIWGFEGSDVPRELGNAHLEDVIAYWGASRQAVPSGNVLNADDADVAPLGDASRPHAICRLH